MQTTATGKLAPPQQLQEAFLSLNLAFVAFYYIVVSHLIDASYSKATSDAYTFLYYFFRAAVRLNRLLHYHPSGLQRYAQWPNAGGRLGVELAFALTTVFISVLFLAALHLVRRSRYYISVLRSFGGLVFALAFPTTYILLFDRSYMPMLVPTSWSVPILELICATVLVLIYLLRPFPVWGMGIMMLLHYCFWALVYAGNGAGYTLYGPVPHPVLLLLIPVGGAVWLYYCRASSRDSSIKLSEKSGTKMLFAGVAVSLIGLGTLWLPGPGYSLVHAKNRDTLTVEMSHPGGAASPEYKITVHGNGTVEYVGEHFVRVRGAQASSLNEQQMQEVLVGFDRADFFSLEDQAFAWGYHTARVSVRITVDGKTKEVTSDMYHVGAKAGLQAKFVDAATNPDGIIETDRWVKCDEARCQP